MNLEEFVKSQKTINDKILENIENIPLWVKNISGIRLRIPSMPGLIELSKAVIELHKSDFNNEYHNTFKRIEEIISLKSTYVIHTNFNFFLSDFSYWQYDFSKLFENVEIENAEIESKEIQNKNESIIITETSRIKVIISEIYNNNLKLFSLHHREFEKIIAELLYNKGFVVELTKQTRDNGYDILALKYVNGFSPIKYLVECKRYAENRKIGVEIIRSFKEVLQTENANKGIIVTTSYFTSEAIKKQKETPLLLDYKNKDDIIEWVNDYFKIKTYR